MIPQNVMGRVFQIKYKKSIGTCFAIEFEGKQYITTAKHVVKGVSDGDEIHILHDDIWKTLVIQVTGIAEGDIDISVLAANQQLVKGVPVEPDIGGLTYGQDVYFLGYPFGKYTNMGDLNKRFPVPFVKSAIVSNILQNKEIGIVFLDGYPNRGFSGGPVVFKEPNKSVFKIASVISSFESSEEPTIYQGQEIPIYWLENTGIIETHSIKHATDMIKRNPNGFLLSKNDSGVAK